MSTAEQALERFDALFAEAWGLAAGTEARLRDTDPVRAAQLRALLRQLHRAREQALHGDGRPGDGGGLGLVGMVGRGFELDLDPDPGVRAAADAARALDRAFTTGLGLAAATGSGGGKGWEEAARHRPPTPAAPPEEPAPEPPRRRGWWRGRR